MVHPTIKTFHHHSHRSHHHLRHQFTLSPIPLALLQVPFIGQPSHGQEQQQGSTLPGLSGSASFYMLLLPLVPRSITPWIRPTSKAIVLFRSTPSCIILRFHSMCMLRFSRTRGLQPTDHRPQLRPHIIRQRNQRPHSVCLSPSYLLVLHGGVQSKR